jgi:general secretion pathway protein B
MSFILDALKKSESERQSQGSAEFTDVPRSTRSPGVSRWVWVLGLLLAINLVVVFGLLLRPEQAEGVTPVETRQASFAEQVSEARLNVPPQQASNEPAVISQPAITPRSTGLLPSIHEVRASGAITLPDLHIDIHVYSDVPEDRFVFINMAKQREGTRLSEGPVVTEITPEGVVLNYQGTLFLLPRE